MSIQNDEILEIAARATSIQKMCCLDSQGNSWNKLVIEYGSDTSDTEDTDLRSVRQAD